MCCNFRCETEINECESSPCENNSTCVDLVGRFECNCTANYTGVRCEFEVSVVRGVSISAQKSVGRTVEMSHTHTHTHTHTHRLCFSLLRGREAGRLRIRKRWTGRSRCQCCVNTSSSIEPVWLRLRWKQHQFWHSVHPASALSWDVIQLPCMLVLFTRNCQKIWEMFSAVLWNSCSKGICFRECLGIAKTRHFFKPCLSLS